jgi:hypothetical protein
MLDSCAGLVVYPVLSDIDETLSPPKLNMSFRLNPHMNFMLAMQGGRLELFGPRSRAS